MSGEKTEPPSRKKLDELRKRGEVAYSAELVRAAALFGAIAGLWIGLPRFAAAMRGLLEFGLRADATANEALWISARVAAAGSVPALLGAAVAAAAASLTQTGFGLFVERLAPDLTRLGSLASMRERWRLDALVRGATGLTTALIGAAVVIGGLHPLRAAAARADLVAAGPLAMAHAVLSPIGASVTVLVGLAALAALIDRVVQANAFFKRHRMSRQELRDEAKESDGNPEVKAQRRRMAREIASGAIRQGVARADVVVRNPTHVAVGLRYRKADGDAPIVTVVGSGETARRILREARRRRLPEVTDVRTARSCVDVPVGEPIPEAVFEPVAVIFRWLIDEGLIDPDDN